MVEKIVFVLFIILVFVAAGQFSSEETSSETDDDLRMLQIIQKLLNSKHHLRQHKARTYCGHKAVKKVEKVCPVLCSIVDENLLTDMCSMGLSDDTIQKRCCP